MACGILTFQAVTNLLENIFLMRKRCLELLDFLLLLVHLDGIVLNGVESLRSVMLVLAKCQPEASRTQQL